MAADLLGAGAVGAAILPNSDFASESSGTVRHVGRSKTTEREPDNNNDGSAEAPWKTIAHALEKVQEAQGKDDKGHAILVHEGVYLEGDLKFTSQGKPDAPMRITAAPGEKVVIQGQPGGKFLRFEAAAYWVVEGLEVAAGAQEQRVIGVEKNSSHIVLRNLVLHGGTAGTGVNIETSDNVSLLSSQVYNFSKGPDDSHAITVRSDSKVVLIAGCTAHGNSGDGIQLAGPDRDPEGNLKGIAPPEDVTIEHNHFYSNGENGVDLKSCKRVSVRANNIHGYRPKKDTSKQGDAVVVHQNAESVLIEGNSIWNSGGGISLGASNGRIRDIAVRGNFVFDIRRFLNDKITAKGDGIRARRAASDATIEIVGNLVYDIDGSGILLGDEDDTAGVVQHYVVSDNVVYCEQYAIEVRLGALDATIDRNLYRNPGGDESCFRHRQTEMSFDKWVQRGYDANSLEWRIRLPT